MKFGKLTTVGSLAALSFVSKSFNDRLVAASWPGSAAVSRRPSKSHDVVVESAIDLRGRADLLDLVVFEQVVDGILGPMFFSVGPGRVPPNPALWSRCNAAQ